MGLLYIVTILPIMKNMFLLFLPRRTWFAFISTFLPTFLSTFLCTFVFFGLSNFLFLVTFGFFTFLCFFGSGFLVTIRFNFSFTLGFLTHTVSIIYKIINSVWYVTEY